MHWRRSESVITPLKTSKNSLHPSNKLLIMKRITIRRQEALVLISNLGPFFRGIINVALNSFIGYGVCKIIKNAAPKDVAITLAIDTTCRIATKHLFDFAFGSRVDKPGNMIHFSFLLATGLIQPISVYLTNKLFQTKSKNDISFFGYIALSWKVNIMIKDIGFSSGLFTRDANK